MVTLFFPIIEHSIIDGALFDLVLESKLRGCDLVSLRIGDIVTKVRFVTVPLASSKKPGDLCGLR